MMPQQGGLQDYQYQYNKGANVDYIVIHDPSGTLVQWSEGGAGDKVPMLDALGIRQLSPESGESNGYKIYPDSAMTGWTNTRPDDPDLQEVTVAVAADTTTQDGTLLVDVLRDQGIPVAGLAATQGSAVQRRSSRGG